MANNMFDQNLHSKKLCGKETTIQQRERNIMYHLIISHNKTIKALNLNLPRTSICLPLALSKGRLLYFPDTAHHPMAA